jgi:hypothetical protein
MPQSKFLSNIASKFFLADWRVTATETGALAYEPVSGESSQSGFHPTFDAQRHTGYYISKIIVPLWFGALPGFHF